MDNLQVFPQLVPVFQEIENIIGKDTYDMWLRPADFDYTGTVLTISLPNQFWAKQFVNATNILLRTPS